MTKEEPFSDSSFLIDQPIPLSERTPMNLDTTLSTIASTLPQELDQVIGKASAYIPQELSQLIWHASSYLPSEIDFVTTAQFMLYFGAASLILGILSRMVLGKRSSLNHSLSSAMGILFIYAVTIVVYTFKPWNLELLLSPLPFVTFAGDYMIVFPITDAQFTAVCSEILSLIILAFLVNLLDNFFPKGNNVVSWYLMRFITLAFCMGLHLVVNWAMDTYLPEILVQYAPMVLLFLLAFMVLSGVLNLVLGLVIAVSNPFLGAMYTFFFSNIIGKQLSKAIFTSAILCLVVYLMEFFGYVVICINATALLTYIPLALVLLLLWYLIGHVL